MTSVSKLQREKKQKVIRLNNGTDGNIQIRFRFLDSDEMKGPHYYTGPVVIAAVSDDGDCVLLAAHREGGGALVPWSDEPDAAATMPGGGQRSAVTLNFDTPFDGFAQVITADHTGPVVVFGVTTRGEAVMIGKIDDETRAQWNREASQIGGHA